VADDIEGEEEDEDEDEDEDEEEDDDVVVAVVDEEEDEDDDVVVVVVVDEEDPAFFFVRCFFVGGRDTGGLYGMPLTVREKYFARVAGKRGFFENETFETKKPRCVPRMEPM
jgi:hypothetical protein